VSEEKKSRRFRRGTPLLPALFTVGNIFLGFWAIIKIVRGGQSSVPTPAQLIGLSIILDVLDGKIARYTGTTSEFGGELDSLADVISFGVAPAILAYSWAFQALPRAGWLVAFLFVMCGTMRLARFNVQRHVVDGRYFVGMPIPAAAGQVAAVVNFTPAALKTRPEAFLAAAAMAVLALLMVSTLRYRSFKGFDLRARQPYVALLAIAIPIAVIALHPDYILVVMATVYSLSAPLVYVVSFLRRRGDPPPQQLATGAAH
jgi:CDP-diacylglycerol--serine O-phosphatidyltransferase